MNQLKGQYNLDIGSYWSMFSEQCGNYKGNVMEENIIPSI